MKKIFLALSLGFLSSYAAAIDPQPTTGVAQQYQSSMTCTGISISSASSIGTDQTLVNTSTQTLWRSLSILNRDSTLNLYCGDNVDVSSQTSAGTFSAATGWKITAGSAATFTVVPGQPFYCCNDGTAGAVNATVCKGR